MCVPLRNDLKHSLWAFGSETPRMPRSQLLGPKPKHQTELRTMPASMLANETRTSNLRASSVSADFDKRAPHPRLQVPNRSGDSPAAWEEWLTLRLCRPEGLGCFPAKGVGDERACGIRGGLWCAPCASGIHGKLMGHWGLVGSLVQGFRGVGF